MTAVPSVSAIVLAWKAEPWFTRCIEALLASADVALEIVIVDNGCTTDEVEKFADHPAVRVVRPGRNLGYAGGNNVGAAQASGEYLALVNSDLVVEPLTLRRLIDAVNEPGVGVAVASVRLSTDQSLVNAGANPVHVLGLSWSGNMGEPEYRTEPVETAGASGACVLTHRAHWWRLGGFDEQYFAYHEDTEFSIRTWWTDNKIIYVPDAIGVHRYEVSRNPLKMYLSERNRLMFVLTIWSPRALILLLPPMLALEFAMLIVAIRSNWAWEKIRGWGWLWKNRSHIRRRRRLLRGERTVPDRQWMRLLTAEVDAAFFPLPFGRTALNTVMRGYWTLVRQFV